ncbi:MAG: phosphate/phosphite/phosphonate ABC transporter substrate-binding protein [Paraglaciecola sp.]|uniref:phosphate/phosphite/phosphonate ABC transporter substrate-binding protein n=1 Tax=Paraglaciecola sp. TaxID=1920173 RepID=UPI0032996C52
MYKLMLFISLLMTVPCTVAAQDQINSAKQSTLTFAIVPQQSAERLAVLWTPILQFISQHSALDIVFVTAKDIPTFEERLKLGQYDIAYMNPYHYVVFHESSGYKALAKQIDKSIKGVIVAKKGSNINSIHDLAGHRLAFPAPAAFAATILPQAELHKLGIAFTPSYVSSHDSVYLNVSRGFFSAGGGIQRTLNNMPVETQSMITTIWQSAEYTPHAVATHPRMEAKSREKILAALLNMSNTEEGVKLLKNINFNGFEPALNKDWDDVRALHIKTSMSATEVEQ